MSLDAHATKEGSNFHQAYKPTTIATENSHNSHVSLINSVSLSCGMPCSPPHMLLLTSLGPSNHVVGEDASDGPEEHRDEVAVAVEGRVAARLLHRA